MWTRILKAAKANGYDGKDDDLAAVKAFVDSKLEIQDADGNPVDVDAAYIAFTTKAANTRKAVTLEAGPADDEVVIKSADLERLRRKAHKGNAAPVLNEPHQYLSLNAERKSFEAKAARGETVVSSADAAEVIGAWAKLAFHKGADFPDKSLCQEICTKANVTYDFASGGFAIPEILRNELINIRPRYSALDRLLGAVPLPPQGDSVPRRSTGVTVYSPAEGTAPTESNPTGDQVKLTPYVMSALSTVSKAQLAASIINFGEWTTNEMAYAIAKKEEEIYILGDATSTYFNQTGLLGKLSAQVVAAGGTWTIGTNATNAEYHSAVVRAAGNLWSEITYDNLMSMVGRPVDCEGAGMGLVWLCNRAFYYTVMVKLATDRGGATRSEVINGIATPMFEGFPVVFSNAMPATQANGQVCLYFGEFASCTKRGNVPTLAEMSVTTERYWELGKVGYKMDVSKAVNCHDLGTANATTPAQTVPFAALVTAES